MVDHNEGLITHLSSAFGPHIGKMLLDPDIIEIMLNPDGKLWGDNIKTGRYNTNIDISPGDSLRIIQLVAYHLNAECHETNPIISAELPGSGSRFQGMIPPVVQKPTFTIRKKAIQIFTLDQYVQTGIMTLHEQQTIINAVKSKQNILVIGSTGSGKTTLCNAILDEIAKTDSRIIIIEDTQELQCNALDNVCIRSNEENEKTTMQAALKSTMRLRPDRIVVGEVRDGAAALALLDAWNTGHPGGLCTLHADSAMKGLRRIESLCQRAVTGQIDRETIAEAINLAIFICKTPKGRKVKEIIQIHGYENGKYIFTSKNE